MTLPEIDHVSFFAEHALYIFRPWSHYRGDMVVCIRKVLFIPRSCNLRSSQFSFRFVNNIPPGKRNGKPVRENVWVRNAKIGPDLRLARWGQIYTRLTWYTIGKLWRPPWWASCLPIEANGRSPLPVFSLRSVASVLVEATACRLVNSPIFCNKIQEIKDVRKRKFSASIFKEQLVTWQFVAIFSVELS